MTAKRKRRGGGNALHGKRATVTVNRGGAEVVVHDVAAEQAFAVLCDALEAMEALQERFPDIKNYLHDHHGDYAPNPVFDDEWAEEGGPPRPAPGDPPTVGFRS